MIFYTYGAVPFKPVSGYQLTAGKMIDKNITVIQSMKLIAHCLIINIVNYNCRVTQYDTECLWRGSDEKKPHQKMRFQRVVPTTGVELVTY